MTPTQGVSCMNWAALLALILEMLKVVVPIVTQPHMPAGSEEMDPALFPDELKARVCELASYLRH